MELFTEAAQLTQELINHRRFFHSHPGTGFDIRETLDYVEKVLQEENCSYEPCGKAGLKVILGGKKPGKTFLLRSDMDALPIPEETSLSFKSKNGNMHACGHDFHTSILLGAAKLLKKHDDDIPGTVILMFQPAEEIMEGAEDMIHSGILENPAVDAALMVHVTTGRPIPTGTIIIPAAGIGAAAADFFEIRVKGIGCHGSSPNTGIDPITAAAHILLSLQELHARELSLKQKAVLTIGSFQAGSAANAIPAEALLKGSIRSFDEETRNFLKKRLSEIAGSTASVFRATAETIFTNECPTLINNEELVTSVKKYLSEIPNQKIITADKAGDGIGSEDFAYITQKVPAIMLVMSAGSSEDGYQYPQHHPKADFDEKVLSQGAAIMAYTALQWLNEHEF